MVTEIVDCCGKLVCCITKFNGNSIICSKPVDLKSGGSNSTATYMSIEDCCEKYEMVLPEDVYFSPLKVIETVVECDNLYHYKSLDVSTSFCALSSKKLFLYVLFIKILPWITRAIFFSNNLRLIIKMIYAYIKKTKYLQND